ncbi:MAG: restriction endonuclease subunit S [Erysipelotrichaceae bacterium]|nr:restriction endonuclease subunit S [Erysipelotrichaceae bacterium]
MQDSDNQKEQDTSLYFVIHGGSCSLTTDNTPYEKIGNSEPVSIAEKAPYEIPESWEWCRVGDLFTNMSGLAYKKEALNKKTDSMIRVLRGGNISDESYSFKADDVFISSEFVKPELHLRKNYMITPAVSSLEHIGKIALIDRDYTDTVVGGFVLMLLPLFNDDIISRYLLYAFSAKHHRDNCRSITHKSGQAFYNMSRELLMNLPVPFPPRNEMQRIVDKLDIILPYASKYGLIEGKLSRLNNSFPEQLKKSILQLAVQGKLVPQDPSDEPASVLLERIRAEKERLIKDGKIKRDKNESIIFRRDNSHYEKLNGIEHCIDDEIPFEIPNSWAWSRLGNILNKLSDGTHSTPKYVEDGIPFISVKDVSSGVLSFLSCKYISEAEHKELYERCNPEFGDLLLTKVGTTGIPVIVDTQEEFSLFVSVALLKFDQTLIYNQYLLHLINSPLVQKQAEENTRGVGNKNWVMRDIAKTLIAIPPVEEQYRIVRAIEELFPYCDKL